MKKVGVIIARFQTPYLHDGHKYLIDSVLTQHHKVAIVLGIAPVKGTKRNPFDFYTRERMLKSAYPQVVVLPLPDYEDDRVWSAKLDTLLTSTFLEEPLVLYGSRSSFIPYYWGTLPVEELPEKGAYSATDIREEVADKVLESEDFRIGINYACQNTYRKVYPTVDVAVLRNHQSEVLLGRKKYSKQWRLPGGFADPSDSSFEAAAIRELEEECGPLHVSRLHYLGSFNVTDWRYRREEDKIITTLFATDWVSGQPEASDDLAELDWFPIQNLESMMGEKEIVSAHFPLLQTIIQHTLKTVQYESK